MKVCVSGGLGFIGSRLARRYAERGDAVVVLDNVHPQIHPNGWDAVENVRRYAQVIIGDVSSESDWDRALLGAELVLHMAAETGTGQSLDKAVRYCVTNVVGTAQLAEALARNNSVNTVFLPSSRAIYGEGAYRCLEHGAIIPKRRTLQRMRLGKFDLHCPVCEKLAIPVPTDEDFSPQPASIYAATKLSQEHLLTQSCESSGRRLQMARYQNVYGPGQSLNNPYTGVLAIFSSQIMRGKTLDIYEDGRIVRDFVYIDDVVNATVNLIDSRCDLGPVNIGTGIPTSMLDVVHAFEAAFDREVSYEITGHFRYGDIRHAVADSSRSSAAHIQCRVDLRTGIKRLVDFTIQQTAYASTAAGASSPQ